MESNKSIVEYKFKPGLALELEILSIKDLYAKSKKQLTLPHRADFYHIIWIEKGNTTHLVDFKPVKVSGNSLLFINKGKVHFFDSSEKFEGKLVLFTDRFFCKNQNDIDFLKSSILFNDLLENSPLKLGGVKLQLVRLFELMEMEAASAPHDCQSDILKNYLHNLLLLCDEQKRKLGFKEIPKGPDRDYAILFMSMVNENFGTFKSVKAYAKKIHISEKRLNRATSKIFGKSPKEMINDRVLLEVKRLLVHTNQTIKQIGFSLGFNEPTNFIKYFRQHEGQTPSEFREAHL
jgi:AraC family transcriptional regulator, transcriptional activator of pobA